MTDALPNETLTLTLSRGWRWRLRFTEGGRRTVHIEQNHPEGEPIWSGIAIQIDELSWVAHWLRGAYTADEWPPQRRFPGGSVLSMEPVPRPELCIELLVGEWPVEWHPGSSSLRVMLFEEDLRPLVEWLETVAATLGVSIRGRRRT